MKKRTLLFTALLSISAHVSSETYAENGFWLSGSFGKANFESVTSQTDKASSLNFNAGYDFNSTFSLYGGYGAFQNITDKSIAYFESGLKVKYSLSSDWSMYSDLALTSVSSSFISGRRQPKISLGAIYQISPRIATQFSIDNFKSSGFEPYSDSSVNQFSWGLTYYFDRPKKSKNIIQQITIHQ